MLPDWLEKPGCMTSDEIWEELEKADLAEIIRQKLKMLESLETMPFLEYFNPDMGKIVSNTDGIKFLHQQLNYLTGKLLHLKTGERI